MSVDDLPDEVLSHIFWLNTIRDPETRVVDTRKTLISICLVCKRWHEAAYNYSAIWNRVIDFEKDDPTYITTLLQRSGSTPIQVGGNSAFEAVRQQNSHSINILRSIFEHNSRIETMNLNIRYAPWDFICQNFLRHPAPALEFVNLVTSCPFPDCAFPGPLFANQAPRLTRFHMQRCLTDFSSPTLHNLTQLSVSDIVGPEMLTHRPPEEHLKIAPTVRGWLNILRNMPALRYLTLVKSVSQSPTTGNLPRITLPDLRLLSLSTSIDECASMLSHIDLPTFCGIRLRCMTKLRSQSTEAGHQLLACLSERLFHWQKNPAKGRHLLAKLFDDRIYFGNSRRVGFIWNVPEEEELRQHAASSVDPLFSLALWLNLSDSEAQRWFRQLLTIYESTYSTTTSLDFWIDSLLTSDDISFLTTLVNFHAFTAVETLDLFPQSPVHFLPLFQNLSSPGHVVFPSLRTLCLTGTMFESSNDPIYQTLISFLLGRAELETPLVSVWVKNGEINDVIKGKLEEIGRVKVVKYEQVMM